MGSLPSFEKVVCEGFDGYGDRGAVEHSMGGGGGGIWGFFCFSLWLSHTVAGVRLVPLRERVPLREGGLSAP